MSALDNLVIEFKNSMALAAIYAKGDDQTDVVTPNGNIPSIAKQARINAALIAGLMPDISNRLRIDIDGGYTVQQQAMARSNIGLSHVDDTADMAKPISTAVAAAVQVLVDSIATKQPLSGRNNANGYLGLTGMKLTLRNNADTISSLIQNNATIARAWGLPDKDGTFAMLSDITGTNSGNNTGDETTARVKGLLGITTLSGVNTGDETNSTILTKLGITNVSGSNTGDETRDSVIGLIGYEPLPQDAIGNIGGVPPLDSNRLIPSQYLPAAFASIETVADIGSLPNPGVIDRIYITQADSGLFYWNQVAYVDLKAAINNTDQLAEGSSNQYFTMLRSISSVLTTYSVGANNAVVNTDTIAMAIGKLQSQINTAITNSNSGLALKEVLTNKATSFATVNNTLYPTVQAVTTYVDARLVGVLDDRGNFDASAGTFPTTGGRGTAGAPIKGDLWFISVQGMLGGVSANVGDSVRALVDSPGQTAANWNVLESNIGYSPENAAFRDIASGYVGMTGFKINFSNAAGLKSFLINANTSARNYTFPDKDITVAGLSDIAATSTGVNSGDETQATILTKLGASAVTGNNTGDETQATILTKIGSGAVAINTNGTVRFTDAANAAGSYNVPFGDSINAQTALKTDSELSYSPSTNTLSTYVFAGRNVVLSGNTVVAQTVDGNAQLGSSATAGLELIGRGSAADLTLYDRNKVARIAVTAAGINITGPRNGSRGADIASAATINLTTATGDVLDVTGIVAVTAITLVDGAVRFVRFAGSTVLTNNASIILPSGQNITTATGDYAIFIGRAGGVVHCAFYQKLNGSPLVGGLLDKSRSLTATTAATSIDLNVGDQAVVFKLTVSANTTVTFSNPPAAPNGELFNFSLIVINDATAGRGMAFGNTIKWAGGNLPPRTTTANAIDVWTFYVDGGVYYGSLAIADAK